MKKLRGGCGFLARLCLLALLLLAAFAWAGAQVQPTFVPPWQDTMPSVQPTTEPLGQLSTLLDQLSQKVADLQSQVQTLNQQLDQSRSSLTASETALELSKKLKLQEATAASQAIRAAQNSGLWWQRGACVAAGAFAGYLVDKWPGSAYGVAAGAAIDAVLEISGLVRIRL